MVLVMTEAMVVLPAAAHHTISLPLGPGHKMVDCELIFAHAADKAQARAQAFADLGAHVLKQPEQRHWPIHAHAYLEDAPQWLVSLSHTRREAVLVASSDRSLSGWGVDIESTARLLHRNPAQRVAHPEDAPSWTALPLAHWTLKEAVYKALDSTRALVEPERRSPLLSELVIGQTQWRWAVDEDYRGACSVMQIASPHGDLWCALATVWG